MRYSIQFDREVAIIWFVALLGITTMAFVIVKMDQSIKSQCAEIMSFARTPRDSMDASVACAKIGNDAATAIAIGSAAGAAAGVAASRR
jgi:ABC-type transport system involved in cytochrome c biogenesis permease subunit